MSAIVNGKFLKGAKASGLKINSQYKAYRQSMQYLDHKKDIIQPRKEGHANPEFIQAYPEEAQKYFTEGEIRKWAR